MNYLTADELIVIHEMLLGEFGGIRGITEAGFGRLEAAASVPQQSMFGVDLYVDLPSKAGALAHAIIRNHPFSDGNKRVAVVALVEMLARNGAVLTASNDEVYTLALTAANALERSSVATWVSEHMAVAVPER
jgi:death-on-curing protein